MNAMVVEIFHMFSKPLHHSLLITSSTSLTQGLKFTAIDLTLTFPAYLLIFSVIWNLIKRYDYSPFAFFFLMALGQSLGDGNAFFIFNPMGLIFVPYIMLNYWAMNFVPYLVIRPYIIRNSAEYQRWKKFALPIVLIPLTYIIAGGAVFIFGTLIGWLPK